MSINKEQIFQKVKIIIIKNCEVSNEDIFLDTRFDNINCDSLDILCIFIDIEKEYKITIEEEQIIGVEKVEDMVDVIIKNLQ